MFVKVCANTSAADALLAVQLGVEAVGFVFAPSKRRVTAEQVAAITRQIPNTVMKVGVFTTTDAEEILQVAKAARLNAVQLHGAFDPERVNEIAAESGGMLRVLQVVEVTDGIEVEALKALLTAALRHKHVMAALLDASHGGASGGTGRPFEWARVAAAVKQAQKATGGRVMVAGGLNAENVAEAIRLFEPWGVDVAGGVEASPGKKDPERLRQFVAEARSYAEGGGWSSGAPA